MAGVLAGCGFTMMSACPADSVDCGGGSFEKPDVPEAAAAALCAQSAAAAHGAAPKPASSAAHQRMPSHPPCANTAGATPSLYPHPCSQPITSADAHAIASANMAAANQPSNGLNKYVYCQIGHRRVALRYIRQGLTEKTVS